ncbi:hypothetical protein [Sphingomonas hankookensis]|uniref:hypothetical protein n=1 Tax=Sphingomonas hankookensis TaxID=563996 RepID=UPI003D3038EE
MRPFKELIILGLLAGTGCQKPPTVEEVLQNDVEAAVRATLRDPDSASFSKWTINPNEKIVCGQVNAKNGYGGFTGDEWFVYDNGLVHHIDDGKSPKFSKSFDRCMALSMARSERRRRDAQAELEKICKENKGVC